MRRWIFATILLLLTATFPYTLAQEPQREEVKKPEKEEQEPRPNEEERAREEPSPDQKPPQPEPVTEPAPAKTDSAEDEKEKEKEEEKWDVNNPPYPHRDVRITTTTGTWMNVDVSPDGREVAFDLLGDIYVMPIGGGEARSLTSGIAWDMQPRFSPNGRWIAFTSDRESGDNIWIMNRDGSDPRQVTKETFRLLN